MALHLQSKSNRRRRMTRRGLITRCLASVQSLESRRLLAALTIAQENALPGTPQSTWDVSGSGDANLQGFATDMSVNVGQTVRFKIDDAALAAYHIDIYRMGYYQGNGARLVTTIGATSNTRTDQPAPLTNGNTGLVDCGNWSVSSSWAVPSDATSGIYFARLVREDTGGASLVFFVVRNDASNSDILMKTSDATWEAYNEFGGNSFYQGSSALGSLGTPSGNFPTSRAVQVSYNRPLMNRSQQPGYGMNSQPLAGEYPMVRFLEKNGYNVSYFTDVDTDQRGSLLLNHKVFMSVGHDEYWSGNERASVTAARNAGVNLAFMSGNQIYWKTYYAASTVNTGGTTTTGRTLVCYKETWANQTIDPDNPNTWTGTWRDPRLLANGQTPENELSGTVFVSDSLQNFQGEPLTVDSAFANLRLWRNTSVATLTAGQSRSLGTDIIGYEFDADIDNGYRPAGLIRLSNSSVAVNAAVVDYGNSEVAVPTNHNLVLYKAPSGALVFGAGTVQWAWGLDGTHDNATNTADVNIQQATVNLFADMKVQPTTLSTGLVAAAASTDISKPTSVISSLANNQSLVSGVPVTVSGTATDAGGGVVGGVEVSTDNGATWHPATGTNSWTYSWIPGVTGSIHILTRAADDSGNIEAPSAGRTVNVTTPTAPLSLFGGSTPFDDDSADPNAVEVGMRFKSDLSGYITGIRFYKSSANTGVHIGNLWTETGTLLATATFSSESASGWQQVTFSSPVAISAGTTYIASYHTDSGHYALQLGGFSTLGINAGPLHGLKDSLGQRNGLYSYSSSSTFPSTLSLDSSNYYVDVIYSASNAPDTTPPVVSAVSAGTPGSTTAAITWTTNEAATSQVEYGLTTSYGTSTTLDTNLVLNHSVGISGLSPNTLYHYRVKSRDAAGNLTTSGDFTFTTAAANSTSSFWTTSTTPAVASASDPNAVELGLRFQTSIAGQITGLRFYKGTANTGTHVGHLWDASGNLLATVTFSGETASGWQTANFNSPITIAANTTYVISYYAPNGGYAYTNAYFGTAFTSGNLTAPSGTNGVYRYGAGGGFPTGSFSSSNYWVDVLFSTTTTPDTTPPVISGVSSGTPGPTNAVIGWATDEASTSQVEYGLTTSYGTSTTLDTNLVLNHSAGLSGLQPNTLYHYRVKSRDAAGNLATSADFTFTTPAISTASSFWATTTTPAITSGSDRSAVELGLSFQSSVAGQVTGLRFYKGTANTGTHVGHLWNAAGTLLATVTFSGESATGWQTANFTTPVTITPNTTYVISYYAPAGGYAYTNNYFNSGFSNGSLTATSGANGLYRYGSGGGFPNSSYLSTNYWVDVLFTATSSGQPSFAVADVGALQAVGSTSRSSLWSQLGIEA